MAIPCSPRSSSRRRPHLGRRRHSDQAHPWPAESRADESGPRPLAAPSSMLAPLRAHAAESAASGARASSVLEALAALRAPHLPRCRRSRRESADLGGCRPTPALDHQPSSTKSSPLERRHRSLVPRRRRFQRSSAACWTAATSSPRHARRHRRELAQACTSLERRRGAARGARPERAAGAGRRRKSRAAALRRARTGRRGDTFARVATRDAPSRSAVGRPWFSTHRNLGVCAEAARRDDHAAVDRDALEAAGSGRHVKCHAALRRRAACGGSRRASALVKIESLKIIDSAPPAASAAAPRKAKWIIRSSVRP